MASVHEVEKLAQKVHARGGPKQRISGTNVLQRSLLPPSAFVTPTPIDMRKRSRCRKKLSIQDKTTIIAQSLLLKYRHKDIAKEHRVTQSAVSRLVTKALRNPKFLHEIMA